MAFKWANLIDLFVSVLIFLFIRKIIRDEWEKNCSEYSRSGFKLFCRMIVYRKKCILVA